MQISVIRHRFLQHPKTFLAFPTVPLQEPQQAKGKCCKLCSRWLLFKFLANVQMIHSIVKPSSLLCKRVLLAPQASPTDAAKRRNSWMRPRARWKWMERLVLELVMTHPGVSASTPCMELMPTLTPYVGKYGSPKE